MEALWCVVLLAIGLVLPTLDEVRNGDHNDEEDDKWEDEGLLYLKEFWVWVAQVKYNSLKKLLLNFFYLCLW